MSHKSRKALAAQKPPPKNNPWEILILAAIFFVPSICLTQTKQGAVAEGAMMHGRGQAGARVLVPVSPDVVHFFGYVGVGFSLLLVIFYFRVRKAIRTGR